MTHLQCNFNPCSLHVKLFSRKSIFVRFDLCKDYFPRIFFPGNFFTKKNELQYIHTYKYLLPWRSPRIPMSTPGSRDLICTTLGKIWSMTMFLSKASNICPIATRHLTHSCDMRKRGREIEERTHSSFDLWHMQSIHLFKLSGTNQIGQPHHSSLLPSPFSLTHPHTRRAGAESSQPGNDGVLHGCIVHHVGKRGDNGDAQLLQVKPQDKESRK